MENKIIVLNITSNLDVVKLPKNFKILAHDAHVTRFWIEPILSEEVEYKFKKYPFYHFISDKCEYGPIRMLKIKDLSYVSLKISIPKDSMILGIVKDLLDHPELLVLETKDVEKENYEFIVIDSKFHEKEVEIPFGYIFHTSGYFFEFGLSRTIFLYKKMSEIAYTLLMKMESRKF